MDMLTGGHRGSNGRVLCSVKLDGYIVFLDWRVQVELSYVVDSECFILQSQLTLHSQWMLDVLPNFAIVKLEPHR